MEGAKETATLTASQCSPRQFVAAYTVRDDGQRLGSIPRYSVSATIYFNAFLVLPATPTLTLPSHAQSAARTFSARPW